MATVHLFSASIGIILFPEDDIDGKNLMANAYIALYVAKDQDRNH